MERTELMVQKTPSRNTVGLHQNPTQPTCNLYTTNRTQGFWDSLIILSMSFFNYAPVYRSLAGAVDNDRD
jgi:hypothetical protein